jgi:hypothetical protein
MADFKAYDTVTQGSSGTSAWIPLDPSIRNFSCTVQAVHTGTSTYSVEVTADARSAVDGATATEIALTNMTDLTASSIKTLVGPISGIRVNITSYTSGSVILHVRQAGVIRDSGE